MIERVDPFIGTTVTDLPPPTGLAATWWWPKPQIGNTHPGATFPLGMVSACAYSGAYPTGYGMPRPRHRGRARDDPRPAAGVGFTHFQQSGTGAIRKYYNYFRVTPMTLPLDELGRTWDLVDEERAARVLRRDPGASDPGRETPASAPRSPSGRRAPCTATRSRATGTPAS